MMTVESCFHAEGSSNSSIASKLFTLMETAWTHGHPCRKNCHWPSGAEAPGGGLADVRNQGRGRARSEGLSGAGDALAESGLLDLIASALGNVFRRGVGAIRARGRLGDPTISLIEPMCEQLAPDVRIPQHAGCAACASFAMGNRHGCTGMAFPRFTGRPG